MKLSWRYIILATIIVLLQACTSEPLCSNYAPAGSANRYSNEDLKLNLELPRDFTIEAKKGNMNASTRKTFKKHVQQLDEKSDAEILFSASGINRRNKLPQYAIGSIVRNIDTTTAKTKGFSNRKANLQPYLHKTSIDKASRIVSSEYLVRLDSGYFYLFTYAPIKPIIQNEEEMIITQDSLNSNYSAVMASFNYKNSNPK